uniref:AsIV-cont00165-ORF1 n=1 Tax=Apophua simplicipes ichnovirus TaxID=1329648 RepID=S5DMR6_9VIRU|nr:AsIV-cont00165-ORF1 [Apophua simplicipes ichnovirus]
MNMTKMTLSPFKREKLSQLAIKLNDLNAELKSLKSCQYLTVAQKLQKLVLIMKKRRLLKKIHELIKHSKEKPTAYAVEFTIITILSRLLLSGNVIIHITI